jgi:mycothiol synthase
MAMMNNNTQFTPPTSVDKIPKGYQVRPATFDDLEAAVALFNTESKHLIDVEMYDLADVRQEWHSPGFNLDTDIRVVIAPDQNLVGYMEVWDTSEPHIQATIWGCFHPDYAANWMRRYLVYWAESRARQAIPKAPPDSQVVLQAVTLSKNQNTQQVYQACGLQLIRHSLRMEINLDAPPALPTWPEGIQVRTAQVPEDMRPILAAVRDAFQDHWGHIETPFEEHFQRWSHMVMGRENFAPDLWFIAWDKGQIAGFSLCFPKMFNFPDLGWVGTLGVRRPWRRQGLGLALLQHSFDQLYQRGMHVIGLGVDAQNLTGALDLYYKAGMKPDPRYQFSYFEKVLRQGIELRNQELPG